MAPDVRRWAAAVMAWTASLLVFVLAWFIHSPSWYPFAAPLILGGVPWMGGRLACRRAAPLRPLVIWAVAAVPAWAVALYHL